MLEIFGANSLAKYLYNLYIYIWAYCFKYLFFVLAKYVLLLKQIDYCDLVNSVITKIILTKDIVCPLRWSIDQQPDLFISSAQGSQICHEFSLSFCSVYYPFIVQREISKLNQPGCECLYV